MTLNEMNARSRTVLNTIIQLHLSSGDPVGSASVARRMNRACSSATIRNIMMNLERMGYLTQPHKSAGRVPTDDGYRVYVDSLMLPEPLSSEEKAEIETRLQLSVCLSSTLMENACHLLSRLSGSVSFAVAPTFGLTRMRHVEFVRFTRTRIVVVLVSQAGLLTNRVIELSEALSQDDLQACANYLNHSFSGMTLREIRLRLLDLMREERTLYDALLRRVVMLGQEACREEDESDASRVYLDGASNILDQPELVPVERMRAILRAIEEKHRLLKILNACVNDEGVHVLIGHESYDPDLEGLSLVTATYGLDAETRWGIGVLGSTRMRYNRIVALVGQVADSVRSALQELHS
jgi:heat-inducible transcriptional repressor